MSRSESTCQRDVLTRVVEITKRCLKGPSHTSSFLPVSAMRKNFFGISSIANYRPFCAHVASVPNSVKAELLQHIKSFLESATL